jgi:iron complex transport system ATP-binding protein
VDGKPRYLFLDEPISSLDIKHQITVMEIARDFAAAGGGVIAILHDLNLTAMFADSIAVMHKGKLDTIGTPQHALTDDRLERVYECSLRVGVPPAQGVPFVLPQSAYAAAL